MADGEHIGLAETVAGHSMWIKGHEDLCAERYKNLDDRMKQVFAVIGAALLILVGVTGWSMKTNWDNADRQIHAIEQLKR